MGLICMRVKSITKVIESKRRTEAQKPFWSLGDKARRPPHYINIIIIYIYHKNMINIINCTDTKYIQILVYKHYKNLYSS